MILDLTKRNFAISDTHLADRDLFRLLENGLRPIDLLSSFFHFCADQQEEVSLFCLGDWSNYLLKYASDMQRVSPLLDLLEEEGVDLIILPGNHDPLDETAYLNYSKKVLVLEEMTWNGVAKAGRPIGHILKPSILMTHGDLFDPFWDPEGKGHKIRLSLGQEIIKRGNQAEVGIHPMIDDWIMGGLDRIEAWLLKRGNRLPHDGFIDQASDLAIDEQCSIALTGHVHDLFDVVRNGIRVVNLNAWVPSNGPSKHGLFKKGEVLPGVFDLNKKELFVWTEKGLETPDRSAIINHYPISSRLAFPG